MNISYEYFITICTHNREPILSKISKIDDVGAGLVPALDEKNNIYKIELTHIGKIIENQSKQNV